jgi:hypothetical protein
MHGEVHLVLDCGEKSLRGRGGRVVVQRGGVNVRDLLVELPLGEPDFPDLLELALEKLVRQDAASLQPL